MARFISEKNFQKILERTLRKMELPLQFTEGFNPHPKMSFGHPLPVGIAGLNERFDVFLVENIDIGLFLSQSKELLPKGVNFFDAQWIENTAPSIQSTDTFARYIIDTAEADIGIKPFEKIGKIIEHTGKKIVLLIKVNNFSHKELTRLLLEENIENITREIL